MAKFSDTRVAAIVKGTSEHRVVPFPAESEDEIKVAVRCLSEHELDGCRVEAQAQLRSTAKRRSWDPESTINIDPEFHTRLIERSIIARAFFDADTIKTENPERFFAGEEDVRQLGSVQHQRLMQIYLEHQEWVNPRATLDQGEVDALVEQLGKGPTEAAALIAFERDTLVRLCISLAHAAHANSPNGK